MCLGLSSLPHQKRSVSGPSSRHGQQWNPYPPAEEDLPLNPNSPPRRPIPHHHSQDPAIGPPGTTGSDDGDEDCRLIDDGARDDEGLSAEERNSPWIGIREWFFRFSRESREGKFLRRYREELHQGGLHFCRRVRGVDRTPNFNNRPGVTRKTLFYLEKTLQPLTRSIIENSRFNLIIHHILN